MKRWWPLVALATAQFVMVLDQSVMNVSISQLVADFDTTVTTIQAVITLYCLVMAMLMLTGGKIGDIIGRRRAFVIGLVIYGCGSALTAVAQTVAVLALGLVDPRGHRRRAGAAGDGRPDRRQLRGQRAQGRLRRHRRRRRRRHRDRPHPRRLGHHRALAGGSCSSARSSSSLFILAMTRLIADAARAAGQARASTTSARSCPRPASAPIVLGRPAVEHLGLVQPKDSPGRAVRLLADPLRHRRGRRPALGLRPLAAPPRGDRDATRWCTSTC